MKCVFKISLVFFSFFTLGCAGISGQSNTGLNETKFNTMTTQKRPLVSDHQLMLSILGRPITSDKQMMLAFANQNRQSSTLFVNPVTIAGPEQPLQNIDNVSNQYSQLIAQDVNAVSISGPY
jgi:hypothetical protein